MSGPVLLLGAGPGLATSGLGYLASYLRRHGVEAYARPVDTAHDASELEHRLHLLLDRVRPSVVGISLKWFLHIHRALRMASVIKSHDPGIRVVLGGDTASLYHQELLRFDCVDAVVRGDGEAPLLALVRGVDHPNLARRAGTYEPLFQIGGAYIQDRDSSDSYLSDFDTIFLCESDGYFNPPFVVGGKGCSQACLYCGGARDAQLTNFGRKKSYMRPNDLVRRDIEALRARAYCLVYDFSDHPLSDPTSALRELWHGLDFSKSGILYYAWRVPPKDFVALLANRYESVTLGLDFGCFSERQRRRLIGEHLLKPLPDDAEFLDLIEECGRYSNVRVGVSGVGGLPLFDREDLVLERRLLERLSGLPIVEYVLCDRVHAQPGAPVLEHAERFGLVAPPRSFEDFRAWSEQHAPNGEYEPPLLAYANPDTEAEVAEAFQETRAIVDRAAAKKRTDSSRFADFSDVAAQRFQRAPKSRVFNRYRPRNWWLDFERPEMPEVGLDDEMARIVLGHFWREEYGAVSVPAPVADYVLSAFDQPATGARALADIRAQNSAITEEALLSIIQFFHARGVLNVAD